MLPDLYPTFFTPGVTDAGLGPLYLTKLIKDLIKMK